MQSDQDEYCPDFFTVTKPPGRGGYEYGCYIVLIWDSEKPDLQSQDGDYCCVYEETIYDTYEDPSIGRRGFLWTAATNFDGSKIFTAAWQDEWGYFCPKQYECIPEEPYTSGPAVFGCFSSDMMVNTTDGNKFIKELQIGDMVLTTNGDTGKLEYSEIYMHGHKIKHVLAEFVTLYTTNNDFKISATKDHFVYICNDINCEWNDAILERFGNVVVNMDYIFDYNMKKHLVIKKEIEIKEGLFNPYTLNGNIVVNNIIASCHSQWIFDDFVNEKYDGYLPLIYQILFAPLRWFYSWTPVAWRLFNSLYPYGLNDVENVNIFDIVKQAYWCLFIQS